MAQEQKSNRIGEITGNIGKDFGELLAECRKLLGRIVHSGICNARAIPDKLGELSDGIAAAFGTFRTKPLEAYWNPDAATPRKKLALDAEPVVTVTGGDIPQFSTGDQLPLGNFDRLTRNIGRDFARFAPASRQSGVAVCISYLNGGRPDEYHTRIRMDGTPVADQIRANINAYRKNPGRMEQVFSAVPEELRGEFSRQFAPFVENSLDEIERNVVPYMEAHCELSALEKQARNTASVARFSEIEGEPDAAAKIAHNNAIFSHVSTCRARLNEAACPIVLPKAPALEDFRHIRAEDKTRGNVPPEKRQEAARPAHKVKPVRVERPRSMREQLRQAQAQVALAKRDPAKQRGNER